MLAEETYLRERIAATKAEIDALTATQRQRIATLEAALTALLRSATGEPEKPKVPKKEQGPSGLEIMLRYLPEEGMTQQELEELLQQYEVSKSKKLGMIDVSIKSNIRLKNLELRDGRYYLTDKAKTGRTAKLL